MKQVVRIISVIILIVITAGFASPPASAAGPSPWAEPDVSAAIAENLVPVSMQSNYTQATTRAEFCALAVAVYEAVTGKVIMTRRHFSDTKDVNVEKMASVGVVTGTDAASNLFSPNAQLTREQAAAMLSRLSDAIFHPFPVGAATFADSGNISPWAVESVGRVQTAGVMGGVGQNTFAPQGLYTREQSITTIMRTFDVVKGNSRDVVPEAVQTPTPQKWESTWTEITITGDAAFTQNTQKALSVIKKGSESGYALVTGYVAIIEQNEFSGMRAYDELPTFQVGKATYNASTTWYAGAIVHDAYHSKLFHDALEKYGYVTYEMWMGENAEKWCLSVQIDFLIEIGAPQYEIDHAISLWDKNWWDDSVGW